jgi:hypothetical protein
MTDLHALMTTRNKYLVVSSLLFAVMPTRVFVAISSDIIQVSGIILPFVIAVMIVIVTGDIGFGLPRDQVISARLSDRRDQMRVQLIDGISFNFQLIIIAIAAKAICTWIGDGGFLATVVNHGAAVAVGVLIVMCIDRFTSIIHIVNYLSIGADLGYTVKNSSQPDR